MRSNGPQTTSDPIQSFPLLHPSHHLHCRLRFLRFAPPGHPANRPDPQPDAFGAGRHSDAQFPEERPEIHRGGGAGLQQVDRLILGAVERGE